MARNLIPSDATARRPRFPVFSHDAVRQRERERQKSEKAREPQHSTLQRTRPAIEIDY
jgi:hypothetical protein